MTIKIKMFSDYICPYCYMGKAIIDKLMAEYDIELDYVGFEIHPDTALDGNDLKKQFPVTNKLYIRLRDRGKNFGIGYGDVKILANSRKALMGAEYARDRGKTEEFSLEVFESYFEDCLNIGKDKVLNSIA